MVTANNVATVIMSVGAVGVPLTWVITRHLGAGRRARVQLATDKKYGGLADEYRRLSDLAVTAQEHTDLRLTELGVQLDDLRSQMGQLQHILKEVE
jgi:uncharacterized protein (DUF1786 family)